jgi:hypothetical protein
MSLPGGFSKTEHFLEGRNDVFDDHQRAEFFYKSSGWSFGNRMFRFNEKLLLYRAVEFFFILMYGFALDFSISSVIILERYPESSSSTSIVSLCFEQDFLSDSTIFNPNLCSCF